MKSHVVTLHRSDVELLEEIHRKICVAICERVPTSSTPNIKDIRMIVKKRQTRVKKQCQFCNIKVLHLEKHLANCRNAGGQFCTCCQTYITDDMHQHVILCRTRTYRCNRCNSDFLHASSLRSHQRNCRRGDVDEVSVLLKCIAINFMFKTLNNLNLMYPCTIYTASHFYFTLICGNIVVLLWLQSNILLTHIYFTRISCLVQFQITRYL